MAQSQCLTFVFQDYLVKAGLEPKLFSKLDIIHAQPGFVKFTLPIEKYHTNRLSIMHGGTIASLVDTGGSLAVASKGLFNTGVSTDLNVTYMSSGGRIGDVIRGEARVDKFGKSLAYTSISFYNSKDILVARGSHTKYIRIALKDEEGLNRVHEFK